MTKLVVCINWTEYERGWGSRPDGHTLHIDLKTAEDYVEKHIKDRDVKNIPDEYSNPDRPFSVEIDDEVYEKVEKEGSIWGHVSSWRK